MQLVKSMLADLPDCTETSVDIETKGKGSLVITSIAFTLGEPYSAFVVPVGNLSHKDEHDVWKRIAHALARTPVIGQNFMFDWGVLWEYGIKDIRLWFDTIIAQHLLYTDLPKSLEAMSSLYLERFHHKHMMGEDLYRYNAIDVVTTHEIKEQQQKLLCRDDRDWDCFVNLIETIPALITMEKRGMNVDSSKIKMVSEQLRTEKDQLEEELKEIADRPINPRSSPDLQKYFYTEHNIKPYIQRGTGQPRVDADALERLARRGFDSAAKILEIREKGTLLQKFENTALDSDGMLRCSIKPTGTVTGRLSTSKTSYGTGSNLQNLNHTVGECIIPRPGNVFIEPDLSQAEKRLVALEIGDGPDIEAFKNGEDIHAKQAAIALNKKQKDVTKEERDKIGKRLNHATSYNIGAEAYSRQINMSVKEGKRQLEAYHKNHPQLRKHFNAIDKHLKNNFTIRNFFGRPRRFMGEINPRSAYDFVPQSTVGEIINRAIQWLYWFGPEHLLLLQNIHDSVLTECPAQLVRIDEACFALHYALYNTFTHNGRTLDIPVEFSLGYCWSKKKLVEFDYDPWASEQDRLTNINNALEQIA